MSARDHTKKPGQHRHDDAPKEDKPPADAMAWALIGIGIFLLLTVVYAAGQRSAPSAENAEELQKQQRNQLLHEWQAQGQRR